MDLNRAKREMKKGNNTEQSIKYIINTQFKNLKDISYIKLDFEYTLLIEMLAESPMLKDKNLEFVSLFDSIKQIIKDVVIEEKVDENTILKIDELRNEVKEKLTIITAYSDDLEMTEYILNRVEYKYVEDKEYDDNLEEIVAQIFNFIFSDKDNMVINSRIGQIIAQLPVRLTRNKFYDMIEKSLTIYKEGEQKSLENYLQQLEYICNPKGLRGYGEYLNDIFMAISQVQEQVDNLNTADEFYNKVENTIAISKELVKYSDIFVQFATVINMLYIQGIYQNVKVQLDNNLLVDIAPSENSKKLLQLLLEKDINDEISEEEIKLMSKLEGKQEALYNSIVQCENAIDNFRMTNEGQGNIFGLNNLLKNLDMMTNLNSSSLFIDLEEEYKQEEMLMDSQKYHQIVNQFLKKLDGWFKGDGIVIRRAKMSKILSAMPFYFRTTEELSNYIAFSIEQCNNKYERQASIDLIRKIMTEYE